KRESIPSPTVSCPSGGATADWHDVRRDGVPIGTECNFLTTKLGSIPERGGEILAAEEAMEIEEVRKEVEELYRELVRRNYERAIKKGASEEAHRKCIFMTFFPCRSAGKDRIKWCGSGSSPNQRAYRRPSACMPVQHPGRGILES